MPNFVVIQHLLHVIHAFFMNIFGIFRKIDRGLAYDVIMYDVTHTVRL